MDLSVAQPVVNVTIPEVSAEAKEQSAVVVTMPVTQEISVVAQSSKEQNVMAKGAVSEVPVVAVTGQAFVGSDVVLVKPEQVAVDFKEALGLKIWSGEVVAKEQGAGVASLAGSARRAKDSLEPALVGQAVVKTSAEVSPLQPGATLGVEANNHAEASVRTLELIAVVEEICDAIVVSPKLLRGEGEMRIQLKAGVLDGSEIQLTTRGNTLSVVFQTTTPDAQQLLERNLGQLEQHLAGHLHRYRIAVSVKRGKKDELI